MYLFIYSLIFFISDWVLLIVNRQSNLIIYIKFGLYKFHYVKFLHFCVCMFFCRFVCIYVLPVASVLSEFVMYPVWLCFSKTIRVIHWFYPLKNTCQTEESLLGILSLESQTSKLKLKILNGSLSYSLLFVISSHYNYQGFLSLWVTC